MCSDSSDDTYRDGMRIVQTGYPRQKAIREALKCFKSIPSAGGFLCRDKNILQFFLQMDCEGKSAVPG